MAVTIHTEQSAGSAQDPLQRLVCILKDGELSDENKRALITFSRERFRYRRLMALTLLWAIVLQLPVLFVSGLAAVNFALSGEVATLITWIDAFLAGIVGAYYGITALRPSS